MNESDIILTIAIPTYNRPSSILDTLSQLQRQPGIERCRIVVVDNASETPVSDLLAKEPINLTNRVSVQRNISNLGLSGNILRCFEMASTEWLWILADDDDLKSGAVAHVIECCLKGDGVDMVLFAQAEDQCSSGKIKGVRDFANQLDYWARLGFISVGLYRVKPALELINVGINYAYTLFPFIAMIIHGLAERNWTVMLDSTVLIKQVHKGASTWALMVAINGYIVAELVDDPIARKRMLYLANQWCLGPVGLTEDFARRRSQRLPGLSRFSYEHKLFLIRSVSFRQRLLTSICHILSYLPAPLVVRLIRFTRTSFGKKQTNRQDNESVFGQI